MADESMEGKMEVIIKTKELCKSYFTGKNEIQVLKNINIEIYRGDITVIMGSSGSGKSTLLYSISTMDAPTSGEVKLLGKEISKLKEKQENEIRGAMISFVFQNFNLLHDISVIENIKYCGYLKSKNKKAVNNKAMQLLKDLHLGQEADKYPNELSGGQQQRVALARALINKPDIIFCDEPTGALNSSSSNDVLNLLTKLNRQGQSMVIVTHDIKAAARASRLLYLKDGRIDGDFRMEPYQEENQDRREKEIFEFIKKKGW